MQSGSKQESVEELWAKTEQLAILRMAYEILGEDPALKAIYMKQGYSAAIPMQIQTLISQGEPKLARSIGVSPYFLSAFPTGTSNKVDECGQSSSNRPSSENPFGALTTDTTMKEQDKMKLRKAADSQETQVTESSPTSKKGSSMYFTEYVLPTGKHIYRTEDDLPKFSMEGNSNETTKNSSGAVQLGHYRFSFGPGTKDEGVGKFYYSIKKKPKLPATPPPIPEAVSIPAQSLGKLLKPQDLKLGENNAKFCSEGDSCIPQPPKTLVVEPIRSWLQFWQHVIRRHYTRHLLFGNMPAVELTQRFKDVQEVGNLLSASDIGDRKTDHNWLAFLEGKFPWVNEIKKSIKSKKRAKAPWTTGEVAGQGPNCQICKLPKSQN